MMKKILYFSGIAAVSLLMASCSIDNDQPSASTPETIFSTPVLANSAVMGIHVSFAETNSYRGRYIPYFGINNDCEQFNNYGGVSDPATDKEASLACYSASATNTYMNTANNAWAKLYEAIERANKAISDMDQYADFTNRDMQHLYGEMLTLRGMIYFDLVKAWGDVPYRFEPVTTETAYLPQESRVKVLQKVLDDLAIAEGMVYGPTDATGADKVVGENGKMTTERVSTTFVHGLRARVALFLAGKSEQTNGTLDYNIQDASQRQELYKIAYDECVAGIDGHPNKLESLPFKQNFTNLCQEITTGGLESIYEIPFSDGRGRVLYTWGLKHSSKDQWTQQNAGGKNGPVPTLYYDYDPTDIRRDITVVPYTWVADETVEGQSIKGASNLVAAGWNFGKYRYEWMTRTVTASSDDGLNWQVMRLADLYLMAAEAANELGNLPKAKEYIAPVLNRAYGSTAKSDACNDKESFFNLIVNERKFEFAGEAIRKTDLMRWGLLSDKMAETKDNLIELAYRSTDGTTAAQEACAADYPSHVYTGKYNGYPVKIYYNTGMGYQPTDAEGYSVYGLHQNGITSETDADGKALGLENSSYVFSAYWTGSDTADKRKTDITKVKKYIDNYYLNDPDSKMFWPIWKVFIDSSNGMLTNYYGY